MAPLIALGISVIPEIARLLIGERAGRVTEHVAQAVQAVTGTDDAVAARVALDADPGLLSELRVRLAQIAAEGERHRAEAEATRREHELDTLRAGVAAVSEARTGMIALVQSGSGLAWGPVAVSLTVSGAFFIILVVLVGAPPDQHNTQAYSLLNIAIGALVAAFTAVVNFWIGSSQGSRDKDAAFRALTSQQMAQAAGATPAIAAAMERAVRAVAPIPSTPPTSEGGFVRCVEIVFAREGALTQHPGGARAYGVDAGMLALHRGRAATDADLATLTQAEAREVLRVHRWNPLQGDALPRGVDLLVFDYAVTDGPAVAIRAVQALVGAQVDGGVGPATIAAIMAMDPGALVDRLAMTRGGEARERFIADAARRLAKG